MLTRNVCANEECVSTNSTNQENMYQPGVYVNYCMKRSVLTKGTTGSGEYTVGPRLSDQIC